MASYRVVSQDRPKEPLLRDVILPAEHASALERMKAELGIGGVAYHWFYC
jgi:hypothetical protein